MFNKTNMSLLEKVVLQKLTFIFKSIISFLLLYRIFYLYKHDNVV